MKNYNLNHINVLGSGTAAWICCLYLLKAGKTVTLYRDPDVIVRKIGESTVPIINDIPRLMDMDYQEFLNRVNGYPKLGTLFSGWNGDTWLYYFANETQNLKTSFDTSYACHIDAPGFCDLLEEYCSTFNTFTKINQKFHKQDYRKNEFYIDATGQQSVLSDTVGIKHIPSDFLINDRAVIGNGPPKYVPYTKSQMMPCGWMWSISLKSRMSHGYVFSSKFLSDNDAITQFENHTGIKHENIIKFETLIPEQPWIDNVIFVGLSAGFIEPLNATANFAAQLGIKTFLEVGDNPDQYNKQLKNTYVSIHKWIRALYSLNQGTGDYWEYYRKNNENVQKDIEIYSKDGNYYGMMGKHSWNLLLENMLKNNNK